MKVLTFSNQKGGTCKSTCAVHIAAEAERPGVSTAILELDKQGTASIWGEMRNAPPRVTRIESTTLPPALARLTKAGTALVVLDCPGSHSPAVASAIKAADLVILPCRPQGVDIRASAETLATCQRLNKRYSYLLGPCIPTEAKAAKARAAFTHEGHPVAPTDITQLGVFVRAVETGRTAFEIEPKGKAAAEIAALWKWLREELAL